MRRVITVLSAIILIVADQLIKLLVIAKLKPIGSLRVIDGFIRLNYVENTGAAFGSFSSHTALLSIITLIAVVLGFAYLLSGKLKVGFEYVCILSVLSGGIGNLIDRVFRGYVIDFIEPLFINFAVFNFADILVTCGAVLLIIWMIKDIVKDFKKSKETNTNERIDN